MYKKGVILMQKLNHLRVPSRPVPGSGCEPTSYGLFDHAVDQTVLDLAKQMADTPKTVV